MRSAFSSSSEEESSSEEDENEMDEALETSRFRHELEAESQHVLQEQVRAGRRTQIRVSGATFAHKSVSHTFPL
jgi:hypothetical protein